MLDDNEKRKDKEKNPQRKQEDLNEGSSKKSEGDHGGRHSQDRVKKDKHYSRGRDSPRRDGRDKQDKRVSPRRDGRDSPRRDRRDEKRNSPKRDGRNKNERRDSPRRDR